jgi:hypothetical protein
MHTHTHLSSHIIIQALAVKALVHVPARMDATLYLTHRYERRRAEAPSPVNGGVIVDTNAERAYMCR